MSAINENIKELFPNRKVVAFYIERTHVMPDAWMVALGEKLRERGYATVGLLSGRAAEFMNLEGLGRVFHIPNRELAELDAVSCFITTDLEYLVRFPENSRVLAVTHSCTPFEDPQSHLQGAFTTGSFDGYLVGFPFEKRRTEIKELWDDFPPPARFLRPESDFYLMGFGYPKLCLVQQRFRARMQDGSLVKSICYAPTEIDYAPYHGGRRVEKWGKRIIRMLLSQFPDYNIIFRPSPTNRNEKVIQDIADYFSGEARVVVDRETNYIDAFAASRVLITDLAHSASTFTTITRRPSVYFQPWQNLEAAHRKDLFYTATSLSQLTDAVRHAVLSLPAYTMEYRESCVARLGYLPFDNALEETADALGDFIDARPRRDWLIIRRSKQSPGASPVKVIAAILQEHEHLQMLHAAHYAVYFNHEILGIFALHIRRDRSPELPIPAWNRRLVGLEQENVSLTYGDISPEQIAAMYGRAADRHVAEGARPKDVVLLRQLARLALGGIGL